MSAFNGMEAILSKHFIKLDFLGKHLADQGYNTELIERSPQVPISTLIVSSDKNPKEILLATSFKFVPAHVDFAVYIDVLQIVSHLDVEISSDNKPRIEKLLSAINTRVLMGTYYLNENLNIMFKYVYLVTASGLIDEDQFDDMFTIYLHMQDTFNPVINAVASGEKSVIEAIQQL